jgi:GLPGLI family protein
MKSFTFIVSLLISQFYFSQQIHVKYLRVLSSFTTTHEDLYIKDKQIISIQDSIITNNNLNDSWEMQVNLDRGKKASKVYFVSDISNDPERNFFFTANLDSKDFFIYDKVPKPHWKIDESKTKKIAGYQCYKATAVFRGSNVIAYFTKELPYSAGPFKFYGLPGLILELKPENMNHDIWKAESVNIDDSTKISYKPSFLNNEKLSLQDYIEVKEARMNKIFAKLADNLPKSDVKVKIVTNQRMSIEKLYEWESETAPK